MTATLAPPLIISPTLTLVSLTHASIRREMRNPDRRDHVHRAVMSLFPADLPGRPGVRRATSNILFRLDHPAEQDPRLLVQASTPLRPGLEDLPQRSLGPLVSRLEQGLHVQYRVVLNAVTATGRKRAPVTEQDDLLMFGLARLARAGLASLTPTDLPRTQLVHAGAPLWIAQFDGHALVDDPDRVRTAVTHGIGRAKAYGCGLLSIALT
jgi:CRISPR system Cascade subunit CasE